MLPLKNGIEKVSVMEVKKNTGVLCHISSLPGKYGIGNLKDAARFALALARCGVTHWQILPLVQTGYGDSPYQSVSCISGNPYFIDLDELGKAGLLKQKELKDLRARYKGVRKADYGALYEERYATLRLAFSRFHFDDEDFRAFVKEGKFEDYALFMTAKTVYGGSFCDWDEPLKRHEPDAVETLRTDYHEEYLFWQFVQYMFWTQWENFHNGCRSAGIRLIGDIPLYVAYDSADVWARPELFKLNEDLNPLKVAGVPPDYFSETGQLWGNPVYDWKAHEKEKFGWWTARLRSALSTYDLVRIDHFRGIDRYYEIDFGEETAIGGNWEEGPKEKLFAGIGGGRKNIIAEDLGIIDDGVRALLQKTGFPGMKVLLFAFDGNPDNPFLPHNQPENCVCYTGTHDNDTVAGYAQSLSAEEYILFRSRVAAELKTCGLDIPLKKSARSLAQAFLAMALWSKARLSVLPVQDILALDNTSRMNYPGVAEGNWQYRLDRLPSAHVLHRLKKMIKIYRR